MIQPWVIWLVLLVVFLIWELVTVALVSIWFAIGSLVALIMSLLGASFILQATVMILISAILMSIFFIYRKKRKKDGNLYTKTNCDRLLGKKAVVTHTIDNINSKGQVMVDGQVWSALSENGETIEIEEEVIIKGIRGVKLLVSRLN